MQKQILYFLFKFGATNLLKWLGVTAKKDSVNRSLLSSIILVIVSNIKLIFLFVHENCKGLFVAVTSL